MRSIMTGKAAHLNLNRSGSTNWAGTLKAHPQPLTSSSVEGSTTPQTAPPYEDKVSKLMEKVHIQC